MNNETEDIPQQVSPVPQSTEVDVQMLTFSEAIKEVAEGAKITRLEWGSNNIYGFLKDSILSIHINDKDNQWIVNDGDLLGEDWVVLK